MKFPLVVPFVRLTTENGEPALWRVDAILGVYRPGDKTLVLIGPVSYAVQESRAEAERIVLDGLDDYARRIAEARACEEDRS